MENRLSALAGALDRFDWPRVPCPECAAGSVGLGTVSTHPDALGRELLEAHRRGQVGEEELSGTFIGTLTCDSATCGAELVMAGDWEHVVNEGDPKYGQFGDVFRIRYVRPPLPLMKLPTKLPAPVEDAVRSASELLWASPASAGNRLRHSLELLMDARKIKKTYIDGKGTRRPRSLHNRIDELGKQNPPVANLLEAVKWIGNEGTHADSLTVKDVLEGAAIFERALDLLYERSDDKLHARAREINRARRIPRVR